MKQISQFRVDEGLVGKSEYQVLLRWQPVQARLIAVGEVRGQELKLLNRQGQMQASFRLPAPLHSMEWNRDGEYLGVAFHQSTKVWVLEARRRQTAEFDLGRQVQPTLLLWNHSKDILAVTSSKGHVFLYNHDTRSQECFIGKHSRAIVCGSWSDDDLLALAGEDKEVSVIDIQGNMVCSFDHTFSSVQQLQFPPRRSDTLSVVLGQRMLLLCNLSEDGAQQVRLTFESSYGDIESHTWYQSVYILIAFSKVSEGMWLLNFITVPNSVAARGASRPFG